MPFKSALKKTFFLPINATRKGGQRAKISQINIRTARAIIAAQIGWWRIKTFTIKTHRKKLSAHIYLRPHAQLPPCSSRLIQNIEQIITELKAQSRTWKSCDLSGHSKRCALFACNTPVIGGGNTHICWKESRKAGLGWKSKFKSNIGHWLFSVQKILNRVFRTKRI